MSAVSKKEGRLAGKVAVITGGNSGIGLASALLFQKEGAKIALLGRDKKTVSSAIEALGADALGFVGDVSSQKDLQEFYRQVKERFDRIDVLFVNAGVYGTQPFAEVTDESFDHIFDINVKGAFYSVQKALPLLHKGASIVITTSVVDQKGLPGASIYSASKAAVRSFVRVFATELLEKGIRVNAVAPGPTETPIFARTGATTEQLAQMKEHLTSRVPMNRLGTSDEVAKAALFLASDDSSFTTGAEIMVDGGITQL
jgi:NAD(P)-dependent dehydrogenase (short-subunit alcohol dehydrogenase family)